jgi:elongation factor Ts
MSDYKPDAKDVMKLRQETDAPVNECKQALVEATGDLERAKEILREKGKAQAGKKAGRATGAAVVAIAQTNGTVAGVVLESETDFVTKNEGFAEIAQRAADELLKNPNADLSSFAADAVAKFRENSQVGKTYRSDKGGTIATYVHHDKSKGAIVIGTGDPEALRQVAIQVVAHAPEVVTKDQLSQDFLNKEIEIETKRALDEGKPENIAKNIAQGRVNKETIKRVVLTEQGFYKDPNQTVAQFLKDHGNSTVSEFALLSVGGSEE